MNQLNETYEFTDEKLLYWESVFYRLGLDQQGVPLAEFLKNPYRFLRLAGTGELKTSLDLLEVMPAAGHA